MVLIHLFFPFRYDEGRDGFLDLEELKRMMEKLGAPQTHLDLKAMIKEVDEDGDNKISFREVSFFFWNISFLFFFFFLQCDSCIYATV